LPVPLVAPAVMGTLANIVLEDVVLIVLAESCVDSTLDFDFDDIVFIIIRFINNYVAKLI
jgi:hypothetical protein